MGHSTEEISFRRGSLDDREFLVAAIIEAERSGTSSSMYERVFDLTRDELEDGLRSVLAEDLPGCELCAGSFLLAVVGDQPVGCIATWIEGETGVASSIVKATVWPRVLGIKRWIDAAPKLRLIAEVDIAREPGALQVESVFVVPSFRGRRITTALIESAIREVRTHSPKCTLAQILTVPENTASARAFTSAGFARTRETRSTSADLLACFPGSGRVLWELRWSATLEGQAIS
jgi:GNAT superfamily N-acetyltransferase